MHWLVLENHRASTSSAEPLAEAFCAEKTTTLVRTSIIDVSGWKMKGLVWYDGDLPAILKRLDIDEEHWLYMTQNFESSFKTLVGSIYSLKNTCSPFGYQRMPGGGACESLF